MYKNIVERGSFVYVLDLKKLRIQNSTNLMTCLNVTYR